LPKYVLKRWSKHIRRQHTYGRASYKDKNEEPHVERYDLMSNRFYEIAEVACQYENETKFVLTQLDPICASLDLPIFNIDSIPSQQLKEKLIKNTTPTTKNIVRSSLHVKRRGQPRSHRLQLTLEKVSKKCKSKAASIKSARDHVVSYTPTSLSS